MIETNPGVAKKNLCLSYLHKSFAETCMRPHTHILAKRQKTTNSTSPSVRIERDMVATSCSCEILIESWGSKYSEKLRVVRA